MKVGSTMTLPAGYENITWYGNGPSEGYSDRCSYATVGVYDTTVTDSFFPFIENQTSGNHNGVKWMALTGDDKPYGRPRGRQAGSGGQRIALYDGRAGCS